MTLKVLDIFWWGVIIGIPCLAAYKMIEVSAGTSTSFDWNTNVSLSGKIEAMIEKSSSTWLYLALCVMMIVTILAIFYGFVQKKQREHTTIELSERIQFLERSVDPKRSSSSLMPNGRSRPEDR